MSNIETTLERLEAKIDGLDGRSGGTVEPTLGTLKTLKAAELPNERDLKLRMEAKAEENAKIKARRGW